MESTATLAHPHLSRPIRVAIAEDDDAQREALQLALEEEGFEVDSFEDGFELLDYFDISAAKHSWPDAIVTDVGMPGRSGLEAVALARAHGATIPVFVVTGWTITEVRAQAAHLGNTMVFAKPIDVDHLARAIGELVRVSES
jgi:DNA-binding response OmpR family regulator